MLRGLWGLLGLQEQLQDLNKGKDGGKLRKVEGQKETKKSKKYDGEGAGKGRGKGWEK